MPHREGVNSLKHCCLKRIALSFDKHWFQDFLQYFDEMPRLLYVIGPFDHWTNELIQELISVMIQEKCLRRKHFHVLLQSAVTSLNLSGALPAANHDSVLSILINRCPKLMTLNLSRLNGLSPRAISELLKAFPGMKVLNLEKTKCNDQVLSVMGYCCINLVDLNLSCTPVTNSGSLSLCGGFNSDRPGCKNLVRLNIVYTMIDEIGASHIMENIPGLRYLGFQDICGAIQHGRDAETNTQKDQRIYQLRNVMSFTQQCGDTFVSCPYATEVCLLNGLSDSNISLLTSLPNVQILRLSNFHEDILTFNEGLLPYLRTNGTKLVELELSEIGSVDVFEIARTCPNLERLSLTQTRSVAVFHPSYVSAAEKRRFFSNITHFKIVLLVMEENFPGLALDCILRNAKNLTKLQLLNVKSFTTDLLISSISHNSMSLLTELRLETCSGITGEGIMALLKAENDLKLISLQKCDHVALMDHEKFRKFAAKNNFDIAFEWT